MLEDSCSKAPGVEAWNTCRCQILGGLRCIEESHCEARILVWFFCPWFLDCLELSDRHQNFRDSKYMSETSFSGVVFILAPQKSIFSEGEMGVTGGPKTLKNLKIPWNLPLEPSVDLWWIERTCGATTRFITSQKRIPFNSWALIHHETRFWPSLSRLEKWNDYKDTLIQDNWPPDRYVVTCTV